MATTLETPAKDFDNVPITMTLVITASPWAAPRDGSAGRERRWDGPPPDEESPNSDLAALVERGAWCWPFRRWAWKVWSPFDDESAADGTARSMEEAQRQADAAIRELIAETEVTS